MKIKRSLILYFSCLLPCITCAQSDSLFFGPLAKNFMVEVNFKTFSEDGAIRFDNLQTKYWLNDQLVLRLGLQYNTKNNSYTDFNAPNDNKSFNYEKSILFGVKPGIEFRILSNSRVSPYWGVGLSYTNKSSSSNYVDEIYSNSELKYTEETTVGGAWRNSIMWTFFTIDQGAVSLPSYDYTYHNKEKGFTSYGVNILFGTDVFIHNRVYTGFEIELGYEKINYDTVYLVEDLLDSNGISFYPPDITTYSTDPSGNFYISNC